jgi:hypothetical protein
MCHPDGYPSSRTEAGWWLVRGMPLSPRELPNLLDQMRSVIDPSRRQEMDLMTAVLFAVQIGELAQEQTTVIADQQVRLWRAQRELEKLKRDQQPPPSSLP